MSEQIKQLVFFLEGPRFSYRCRRNKRMVTATGQCPVPKGNNKDARVVGVSAEGKPIVKVTDPARARAAQKALTVALLEHRPSEPLTGAVTLHVDFVFVPPKSWPNYRREAALAGWEHPTNHKSGDRDNLHKLLADCLEAAGFFADDSQITSGEVCKRYGEVQGYKIWVSQCRPARPTAAEWKAMKAGGSA